LEINNRLQREEEYPILQTLFEGISTKDLSPQIMKKRNIISHTAVSSFDFQQTPNKIITYTKNGIWLFKRAVAGAMLPNVLKTNFFPQN
jgi:hypothetical protein